ncbi:MAG: Spo0B domain-containing protein [Clostridia bacterium]|nr:Spo0B domain-containing protein [Clostridia bacterium]
MNAKKNKNASKRVSLKGIQNLFFRTQLILIISLALILGIAGTLINIQFETEKRDQNLQNVAETIANSPMLTEKGLSEEENQVVFSEYLDTLKDTLDDIDVISVVNKDGIRIYHSNNALIGTRYDGNMPDFESNTDRYYAADETGPSGSQRRAYAAVYNEDGEYIGVVMAIMLMKNIQTETAQMLLIFLIITVVAILIELIIAGELSGKVKKSLMGYEPDVFTAMYKMRDNILETLAEGILAFDTNGMIQFANESAIRMLCDNSLNNLVGQSVDVIGDDILSRNIKSGDKERNINLTKADIILDCVPIKEEGITIGTVAILHNRAEYTKLMEELSGTRYLVDSMRANNHDFTNKLHVILGLIQMEMYDDASAYIQNITMVQRENISKVMHVVSEPAVAALLIGKIARASELNVNFVFREGCCFSATDMNLPSEMLITVIGNLLDNAFDAMNESAHCNKHKELMFGIYSKPGAVLITVDDTGSGIKPENINLIFENGFSTKGEGRGTGLYQVKSMVENFDGKITVESQEGVGTSFSVSFTKENKNV